MALPLLALPGLAQPAGAGGLALIIANEGHAHLDDNDAAGILLSLEADLAAAGFEVEMAADATAGTLLELLSGAAERLEEERLERIVILHGGYAVHGAGGNWLLGSDARRPTLANVDAGSVRLDTLLTVAGLVQGGALVALADLGLPERPAAGLSAGLPDAVTLPQGVSLLRGDPADYPAFFAALLEPGTTLRAAATELESLRIDGFDPPYLPFLPAPLAEVDPDAEPEAPEADPDLAAWEAAEAEDSAEAYRGYLAAYPEGAFTEAARAAIDRLEPDPEAVEAALGLSRDARRAIQRDLTELGQNTRGIDGIFGPGTRNAIRQWQAGAGLPETGFLDATQIALLADAAAESVAARERADRAFWTATGEAGDEAGLRAYLARYPQGLFADVARARIAAIEEAREQERAEAERRRDRAAWDTASRRDTTQAYRAYLAEFPRGEFAALAQDRIDAIERPARDERAWQTARAEDSIAAYRAYLADFPDGAHAARARARIAALEEAAGGPEAEAWARAEQQDTADAYRAYLERHPEGPNAETARARIAQIEARANESDLGLPGIARVLIQQRLAAEGFDPGRTDGQFTDRTRSAIAAFQEARGLPSTGYVDQRTLVALAVPF